MKDYTLNRIKAKVEAVNKANAEANRLTPILKEICLKFVGKKVLTVNDCLTAQFQKELPELGNINNNLQVYRYGSRYSIVFIVKASANIEGTYTCLYHETSLYSASLDLNILKSVNDPVSFKTDYTVESIVELTEARDKAKKAFEDAQSNLFPFADF